MQYLGAEEGSVCRSWRIRSGVSGCVRMQGQRRAHGRKKATGGQKVSVKKLIKVNLRQCQVDHEMTCHWERTSFLYCSTEEERFEDTPAGHSEGSTSSQLAEGKKLVCHKIIWQIGKLQSFHRVQHFHPEMTWWILFLKRPSGLIQAEPEDN